MLVMRLFVRNGCITEAEPILMLLIFLYIVEGEDKGNMALRPSDDVLPVKKIRLRIRGGLQSKNLYFKL